MTSPSGAGELIGGVLQNVLDLLPSLSTIAGASVGHLEIAIVEFEHTSCGTVAFVFRHDYLSFPSDASYQASIGPQLAPSFWLNISQFPGRP